MKASQVIKVALIDQMQQIADLGLWFHVAKLLPAGVELLARVRYSDRPNMSGGIVFLPLKIETVVADFYKEFAPEYSGKYATSQSFFAGNITAFLVSDIDLDDKHLTMTESGKPIIYVPQWFEDFKAWSNIVLGMIERGDLEDIEVFKSETK